MLTLFVSTSAFFRLSSQTKKIFSSCLVFFSFFYNKDGTKMKNIIKTCSCIINSQWEEIIPWHSSRNQQWVHGRKGERRSARIPNVFLFLGTSRSMTVDERSQRFTPCCDVRISHPSSPVARFRAQRLYERDARQVERKIKRAPFSPVHRSVITLLCGFCRSCAAFTSRVRVRDELSRLSLCRARARAANCSAELNDA